METPSVSEKIPIFLTSLLIMTVIHEKVLNPNVSKLLSIQSQKSQMLVDTTLGITEYVFAKTNQHHVQPKWAAIGHCGVLTIKERFLPKRKAASGRMAITKPYSNTSINRVTID